MPTLEMPCPRVSFRRAPNSRLHAPRLQQPSQPSPAQTTPFQVLPGVQELGFAPDGRLWTSTAKRNELPPRETARQELHDQFNQPSRPANFLSLVARFLIEPTGSASAATCASDAPRPKIRHFHPTPAARSFPPCHRLYSHRRFRWQRFHRVQRPQQAAPARRSAKNQHPSAPPPASSDGSAAYFAIETPLSIASMARHGPNKNSPNSTKPSRLPCFQNRTTEVSSPIGATHQRNVAAPPRQMVPSRRRKFSPRPARAAARPRPHRPRPCLCSTLRPLDS